MSKKLTYYATPSRAMPYMSAPPTSRISHLTKVANFETPAFTVRRRIFGRAPIWSRLYKDSHTTTNVAHRLIDFNPFNTARAVVPCSVALPSFIDWQKFANNTSFFIFRIKNGVW